MKRISQKTVAISVQEGDYIEPICLSSDLVDFLVKNPKCGPSDYTDLPGAENNVQSTWRQFSPTGSRYGQPRFLSEDAKRKIEEARQRKRLKVEGLKQKRQELMLKKEMKRQISSRLKESEIRPLKGENENDDSSESSNIIISSPSKKSYSWKLYSLKRSPKAKKKLNISMDTDKTHFDKVATDVNTNVSDDRVKVNDINSDGDQLNFEAEHEETDNQVSSHSPEAPKRSPLRTVLVKSSHKSNFRKRHDDDDETWTLNSDENSDEIDEYVIKTPKHARMRRKEKVNYSELDDAEEDDFHFTPTSSTKSGRRVVPVSRKLEEAIVSASMAKSSKRRKKELVVENVASSEKSGIEGQSSVMTTPSSNSSDLVSFHQAQSSVTNRLLNPESNEISINSLTFTTVPNSDSDTNTKDRNFISSAKKNSSNLEADTTEASVLQKLESKIEESTLLPSSTTSSLPLPQVIQHANQQPQSSPEHFLSYPQRSQQLQCPPQPTSIMQAPPAVHQPPPHHTPDSFHPPPLITNPLSSMLMHNPSQNIAHSYDPALSLSLASGVPSSSLSSILYHQALNNSSLSSKAAASLQQQSINIVPQHSLMKTVSTASSTVLLSLSSSSSSSTSSSSLPSSTHPHSFNTGSISHFPVLPPGPLSPYRPWLTPESASGYRPWLTPESASGYRHPNTSLMSPPSSLLPPPSHLPLSTSTKPLPSVSNTTVYSSTTTSNLVPIISTLGYPPFMPGTHPPLDPAMATKYQQHLNLHQGIPTSTVQKSTHSPVANAKNSTSKTPVVAPQSGQKQPSSTTNQQMLNKAYAKVNQTIDKTPQASAARPLHSVTTEGTATKGYQNVNNSRSQISAAHHPTMDRISQGGNSANSNKAIVPPPVYTQLSNSGASNRQSSRIEVENMLNQHNNLKQNKSKPIAPSSKGSTPSSLPAQATDSSKTQSQMAVEAMLESIKSAYKKKNVNDSTDDSNSQSGVDRAKVQSRRHSRNSRDTPEGKRPPSSGSYSSSSSPHSQGLNTQPSGRMNTPLDLSISQSHVQSSQQRPQHPPQFSNPLQNLQAQASPRLMAQSNLSPHNVTRVSSPITRQPLRQTGDPQSSQIPPQLHMRLNHGASFPQRLQAHLQKPQQQQQQLQPQRHQQQMHTLQHELQNQQQTRHIRPPLPPPPQPPQQSMGQMTDPLLQKLSVFSQFNLRPTTSHSTQITPTVTQYPSPNKPTSQPSLRPPAMHPAHDTPQISSNRNSSINAESMTSCQNNSSQDQPNQSSSLQTLPRSSSPVDSKMSLIHQGQKQMGNSQTATSKSINEKEADSQSRHRPSTSSDHPEDEQDTENPPSSSDSKMSLIIQRHLQRQQYQDSAAHSNQNQSETANQNYNASLNSDEERESSPIDSKMNLVLQRQLQQTQAGLITRPLPSNEESSNAPSQPNNPHLTRQESSVASKVSSIIQKHLEKHPSETTQSNVPQTPTPNQPSVSADETEERSSSPPDSKMSLIIQKHLQQQNQASQPSNSTSRSTQHQYLSRSDSSNQQPRLETGPFISSSTSSSISQSSVDPIDSKADILRNIKRDVSDELGEEGDYENEDVDENMDDDYDEEDDEEVDVKPNIKELQRNILLRNIKTEPGVQKSDTTPIVSKPLTTATSSEMHLRPSLMSSPSPTITLPRSSSCSIVSVTTSTILSSPPVINQGMATVISVTAALSSPIVTPCSASVVSSSIPSSGTETDNTNTNECVGSSPIKITLGTSSSLMELISIKRECSTYEDDDYMEEDVQRDEEESISDPSGALGTCSTGTPCMGKPLCTKQSNVISFPQSPSLHPSISPPTSSAVFTPPQALSVVVPTVTDINKISSLIGSISPAKKPSVDAPVVDGLIQSLSQYRDRMKDKSQSSMYSSLVSSSSTSSLLPSPSSSQKQQQIHINSQQSQPESQVPTSANKDLHSQQMETTESEPQRSSCSLTPLNNSSLPVSPTTPTITKSQSLNLSEQTQTLDSSPLSIARINCVKELVPRSDSCVNTHIAMPESDSLSTKPICSKGTRDSESLSICQDNQMDKYQCTNRFRSGRNKNLSESSVPSSDNDSTFIPGSESEQQTILDRETGAQQQTPTRCEFSVSPTPKLTSESKLTSTDQVEKIEASVKQQRSESEGGRKIDDKIGSYQKDGVPSSYASEKFNTTVNVNTNSSVDCDIDNENRLISPDNCVLSEDHSKCTSQNVDKESVVQESSDKKVASKEEMVCAGNRDSVLEVGDSNVEMGGSGNKHHIESDNGSDGKVSLNDTETVGVDIDIEQSGSADTIEKRLGKHDHSNIVGPKDNCEGRSGVWNTGTGNDDGEIETSNATDRTEVSTDVVDYCEKKSEKVGSNLLTGSVADAAGKDIEIEKELEGDRSVSSEGVKDALIASVVDGGDEITMKNANVEDDRGDFVGKVSKDAGIVAAERGVDYVEKDGEMEIDNDVGDSVIDNMKNSSGGDVSKDAGIVAAERGVDHVEKDGEMEIDNDVGDSVKDNVKNSSGGDADVCPELEIDHSGKVVSEDVVVSQDTNTEEIAERYRNNEQAGRKEIHEDTGTDCLKDPVISSDTISDKIVEKSVEDNVDTITDAFGNVCSDKVSNEESGSKVLSEDEVDLKPVLIRTNSRLDSGDGAIIFIRDELSNDSGKGLKPVEKFENENDGEGYRVTGVYNGCDSDSDVEIIGDDEAAGNIGIGNSNRVVEKRSGAAEEKSVSKSLIVGINNEIERTRLRDFRTSSANRVKDSTVDSPNKECSKVGVVGVDRYGKNTKGNKSELDVSINVASKYILEVIDDEDDDNVARPTNSNSNVASVSGKVCNVQNKQSDKTKTCDVNVDVMESAQTCQSSVMGRLHVNTTENDVVNLLEDYDDDDDIQMSSSPTVTNSNTTSINDIHIYNSSNRKSSKSLNTQQNTTANIQSNSNVTGTSVVEVLSSDEEEGKGANSEISKEGGAGSSSATTMDSAVLPPRMGHIFSASDDGVSSRSSHSPLSSPSGSGGVVSRCIQSLGLWTKDQVSHWLASNKLDKICLNLTNLDGPGLQRMAFEYHRNPEVFYVRVKKSLGLTLFQTLVIERSLKSLIYSMASDS